MSCSNAKGSHTWESKRSTSGNEYVAALAWTHLAFIDSCASSAALNQIPGYFNGSGNATYGRLAFCVSSEAEQDFCLSAARLLNTTDSNFGWTCRRPLNTSVNCAADVAAGHSDVLVRHHLNLIRSKPSSILLALQ